MTYSSYLNDKELRAAADRYTEMYGGQFECADTGDVLLYPVPLFTKRLRQATMHKYTVNLLTLWWMPIDEQDLQDIPGFYRRLFQESECSPASGFAMESPLSRTPK